MKNMKRQIGLSMVELLIALAISSLLILGITQIYIDNKRNYTYQQNQAGNLENGRYAALTINYYLGKAGYRRNPSALLETVFPGSTAGGGCESFEKGSAVTGLDADEGVGFCIRYQPQTSEELDCQGEASSVVYDKAFPSGTPAATDLIVLAFKYEPSEGSLEKGRLLCKSLNAATPDFVEVLSGIADLRVDFGTGSSDALDKEISTYIPQADWVADDGAIRSVRYAMLLASREGQRDSDDSKVLSDWLALASDASKTRLQDADKKNIYQVAGSTQTIRNFMP